MANVYRNTDDAPITRLNARSLMTAPLDSAIAPDPVPYAHALAVMAERAAAIRAETAHEFIWLVEHPAIYTTGTSAKQSDIRDPERLPVFETGRGGQVTYHGPGQRIVYLMIDLASRGGDVRALVATLETILIGVLGAFGIDGRAHPGRIGIWVPRPDKGPGREDKIAAIGLRVSRGVTTHGVSLNIDPDLSHYDGIVPCGIADQGTTSFADLAVAIDKAAIDDALIESFQRAFGSRSLRGAGLP